MEFEIYSMNNDEIIKSFLSKSIQICDRCGKIDIKTYERYKLKDNNYILDGVYSICQRCGKTREFSKDEIKQELKEIKLI